MISTKPIQRTFASYGGTATAIFTGYLLCRIKDVLKVQCDVFLNKFHEKQ